MKNLVVASVVLLMLAGVSQAVPVIWLSTSETAPSTTANPSIDLTSAPIGTQVTLYVFVRVDSPKILNGLGIDLVATNPGIVKAVSSEVYNYENTTFSIPETEDDPGTPENEYSPADPAER